MSIDSNWQERNGSIGEFRESFSGVSLLMWCCRRPMRRIVSHQRIDGKIFLLGEGIFFTTGWFCRKCGKRIDKKVEYPGD
jgi:hypothetical protein